MGQPACHLRRATTWEEHETHHHARSGQCCYGHGHLLLMRRVCWSLPRRRATSEGSALVYPPLQDMLVWGGRVKHELGWVESWHGRVVGSFPLTMWLPRKYIPSELSPQEKPRQMGKEGYTINTSRGGCWPLSGLRDLSGDCAGKKCRDRLWVFASILALTRAIPLPRLPVSCLLLQKIFACFLLGDNIGSFVC